MQAGGLGVLADGFGAGQAGRADTRVVNPGLIPGVDVPAPERNRLRKKAALSDFENAAIRKGTAAAPQLSRTRTGAPRA